MEEREQVGVATCLAATARARCYRPRDDVSGSLFRLRPNRRSGRWMQAATTLRQGCFGQSRLPWCDQVGPRGGALWGA